MLSNQILHKLCMVLLVLSALACKEQAPSSTYADIPIQPTTQIKAISAPADLINKPIVLKGDEIAYSELKFQDGEKNDQKIALHTGEPYSGVAVYKLPNGRIFFYETYQDGQKHGHYRMQKNGSDEQGKPDNTYEVGDFVNGELHGLQLTYYDRPEGPLKKISFYNNGKMDSQWSSYYRSGAQWTRRDFKNGALDGKVLVWDEEGVLGKEYTYRNGQMTKKLNHFENQ